MQVLPVIVRQQDKLKGRAAEEKVEHMTGKLYGIGVGPGDPSLMTLKAVRTMRECDILILPAASEEECYAYRIAVQEIPELAKKQRLCLPFPMVRDREQLQMAHDAIFQEIVGLLEQNQTVGLLTIGDPTVYSTYMYIHHRMLQNGKQAEIISAVPSFCAVAARLGISLGEKEEEIHIVPASYEVEQTLGYHGTRVYMKSGKKLQELIDCLVEGEKESEKSYAYFAVTNCGMPTEQIYRGLDAIRQAEGYLTLLIVKECRG